MEFEEPELHIIRFDDSFGAEYRAELERKRVASRQRYVDYLAAALVGRDRDESTTDLAAAVLDTLVVWKDITTGEACECSCHPSLPDSDLHDYGFDCNCRRTPAERAAAFDSWLAVMDEYWESPEGLAQIAARQAEKDDLIARLAGHPTVDVRSFGGMAPEQWWGDVDGHSFYFRERHDRWRIELDLRPTGRFSTVYVGGDLADHDSTEAREIEEGDVIAEGTTAAEGYGTTPVERVEFIADTIRAHIARAECRVHSDDDRDDIEQRLGRRLSFCPACGTRLDPAAPPAS